MKKPNPPKLVTIAVMTTITIVFWIFFTLYQIITAKPEPSVSEKLLEPIIPELDSSSLQKIKDRVFFEEGSFTFSTTPSDQNTEVKTETLTPTEALETPPEKPTGTVDDVNAL
jgi:hypothetical protein